MSKRFEFGRNWLNFLKSRLVGGSFTSAISTAVSHLRETIDDDLNDCVFVDVGCGSGIMSAAASKLGASQIISIDFDLNSVRATEYVRGKLSADPAFWEVKQDDLLRKEFGDDLVFDRPVVFYCWGVAHHTGDLDSAIRNLLAMVRKRKDVLIIALYNDQNWKSAYWKWVKYHFNVSPVFRVLLIMFHFPLLFARYISWRLKGQQEDERAMNIWYDYVDWLGGWPFEVISREDFESRVKKFGFDVVLQKSAGSSHGCNQFRVKIGE